MVLSQYVEESYAADLLSTGIVEVAVTGDRADLVAHAGRQFLPRTVLAWTSGAASAHPSDTPASPLLAGRAEGFAYVCRAGACRLPAETAEQLEAELVAALQR